MSGRRMLLTTGALGLYTLSTYTSFHLYKIYSLPAAPPGSESPDRQPDVSNAYNEIATQYDSSVKWDEWLMGMHHKRRKLLKYAQGSVLEVSAGTGRNLDYYPKTIDSLALSDLNASMLTIAQGRRRIADHAKPTFHVLDATALSLPNASFDTIVQTFGLCSLRDPVAALKEMKRVVKPGGSILLLEHGRSDYEWLNDVLDKTAPQHAQKWGCHWNRDIRKLVQEAGLQVEHAERFHFGTTYLIKIRVP